MAGLDPAIHVFAEPKQDVDARNERGHDEDKPQLTPSVRRAAARLLSRVSSPCGPFA